MSKRIFSESNEELYTTGQVASLLNLDESTVRRWVSNGKATPFCECGGTHLWRVADYSNVRRGKAGRPAK